MARFVEAATAFFDALETGKGRDVVGQYLVDGATFHCDCLPQKTMLEYSLLDFFYLCCFDRL